MNRFLLCVLPIVVVSVGFAEPRYADQIGPVQVRDVQWDGKSPLNMPCITWGGESALFQANGLKLQTDPNSTFANLGVNLNITKQDDFKQQVRDYMSGKTPFLRGTFHMVGLAAEVLNSDSRTKPVCILQETWSLGDHIVARKNIKTLSDLKGTTGIVQTCGPHVGLVDDALKAANLQWTDIKVIWVDDLTGDKGPAEALRTTPNADWCTVITPDMIGLTGGLQNVGSGAEKTIDGGHVLVSTSEMSRSIADVICCRSDFYRRNENLMQKIVAGYLVGVNQVIDMKKKYENEGSKDYENLLRFMQDVFGHDVLPTIEEDAHGLICDLNWVGLPGLEAFLNEDGNPNGLEAMKQSILALAVSRGYAKSKTDIVPADFDLSEIAKIGNLGSFQVVRRQKFKAEATASDFDAIDLDDKTIYAFEVQYRPNETEFPVDRYNKEIQKVAQLMSKFGNSKVIVRAHADPTLTLKNLVEAGKQKGTLVRTDKQGGGYVYSLNGRPFSLANVNDVINAIDRGDFDGVKDCDPKATYQDALILSKNRADNFVRSVKKWCEDNKYPFDISQIQSQGVGIKEPVNAAPRNYGEAEQNMRAEFRLVRVTAEITNDTDFDF